MATAEIVRDESYVKIDGVEKAPGSYDVEKGTEIDYKCVVENVGGAGWVAAQLWDNEAWEGLDWDATDSTYATIDDTFSLKQDRELKFVAYSSPDGTDWGQDDSYGCEEEEP